MSPNFSKSNEFVWQQYNYNKSINRQMENWSDKPSHIQSRRQANSLGMRELSMETYYLDLVHALHNHGILWITLRFFEYQNVILSINSFRYSRIIGIILAEQFGTWLYKTVVWKILTN